MSNRRRICCGAPEHRLSRRGFLSATAAGAAVAGAAGLPSDMLQLEVLGTKALAGDLVQQGKRVILLWLAGGSSQMETWDPKPGHRNGGPFRAIDTNVPGIRISELMPKLAQRMQHTAVIRSLNTRNGDHGGASEMMQMGRLDEPSLRYPDMGAVVARELGRPDSTVPDYVSFYTETEGRGSAVGRPGFFGARYAPIFLTEGMRPANLQRLESISAEDHVARDALRGQFSAQFSRTRTGDSVGSHVQAYARVPGLMDSNSLFDLEQEPQAVRDRYGRTQFGQQVLLARRLVEAGVPFVKVGRAWWDSHGQNFETHLELVTELDHVMSTLLDDLHERGLLEHTLVITLGEFGRTPGINQSLGRDHFPNAWSCSLSGAGIRGGQVYGKTSEGGDVVEEGEINAAQLFATMYQSLGIDPQKEYYVGARPIPLTDVGTEPVRELLA